MFFKFLGVALTLLAVAPAHADTPKQTAGKYSVELRLPPGGMYAQEATDVEFRVTDTSQMDEIQGAAPSVGAKISAQVTMPTMAGMPAQTPKTHAEGVPGDYGIELFFPHGGGYLVQLTVTPRVGNAFTVGFPVEVKDADAARKPSPAPYVLTLATPQNAQAGQSVPLQLIVKDAATKQAVTDFDESHTKRLHLMLVSKDFSWFVHEHPQMQADGTWTIDQTFPSGGEYFVFADTAPKGAGAQILRSVLTVGGPARPAQKLQPTPRQTTVDGLTFTLDAPNLTVGKSLDLTFAVTQNGRPVTDLQPYLGAMGHLMLLNADGQTFVHSHPAGDAAPKGRVTFSARFPKPGLYKAWAQFQRAEKVVTVSFVFDVKGNLP